MLVNNLWLLVLFCVVGFTEPVRHDINEMMYLNIPGGSACFRRLNGTHQFGCSSPQRGAIGIVHVLEDSYKAMDEFLAHAFYGKYIVVMKPSMFNSWNLGKLKMHHVSGIVLAKYSYNKADRSYSPDDVCPNRHEGGYCDSKKPWNPRGNSFLMDDLPFPVFVVEDDAHLDNITSCFKKWNLPISGQANRPLCMLQLKSHMFGAVSSEVCMRRLTNVLMNAYKYCDPMGNENIIYPMINLPETKEKKLIAVITRLDAASLFDGISPGAMSAVSGTASTIILANILNDLRTVIRSHDMYKGIMFMMLNGESFDYIGSQRVVYDMEQGKFMSPNYKVTLDDIGMIIELSQLGPENMFYLYQTDDKEASNFADSLISITANASIKFVRSSLPLNTLPPVSLTTFLKANPNISGVVITNYDTQFTNVYYNGIYDDAENLNYPAQNDTQVDIPSKGSASFNLANAAAAIARGIARAINKDDAITYDIPLSKYVQTTDEILQCFLITKNCKLFQKLYPLVSPPTSRGPATMPLYVGIAYGSNHITRATWKLMAYLSTPFETLSQENCTALCSKDEELKCFWVKEETGDGRCVKSPIRLMLAVSPAFEIEGYDWASGKYSTWTEAVWSDLSIKMFIQPDEHMALLTFYAGVFVFFLSFISVFIINRKSDVLFSPKLQPQNC